ncbi:enoyl-CoA hydratase-related protein [Solimonas marina]|uniref:Enoyl-CoA hydratase/isomerase family protein n=1 Tax=Solimonas marina TaxID=2714601 RepID=A0A969W9Q3_9GAMM|nr:enoyl-CoA hydratase-related protein [Solimonas marina]NKF22144.1 enoyl-CoA hydratase/isomerase family protein [Solimonas marina]
MASLESTVEIERAGGVARLWLNRADVHNAFNETLIAELTAALQALDADAGVRVVVLGGRGKSFCAGADLAWMRRMASYRHDENLADAERLAALLRMLHGMTKPTVARVQGAALGGGTGLVAACDIVLATPQASFGTTEVRLGLIPATISPYVLQAIGARAAQRYFLSGERIDAAEAQRIGLVHEVCEADVLDARLDAMLAALLAGAPQAQADAKRLIADVAGRPIDEALIADTSRRIAQTRAAAEARDGIAAFFDKRRPSWSAR